MAARHAFHIAKLPTTSRCIGHPIAQPLKWPPLAAKLAPFSAARNSVGKGTILGTVILKHWSKTYLALLNTPQGEKIWKALDEAMPNSFLLFARKP